MKKSNRRTRMIVTCIGTVVSMISWAVTVYRIYTEPNTAEERLQRAIEDLYGGNIAYFVIHEDGTATIPPGSTYTEVEE